MTLRVKANDLNFQYKMPVSHDTCLVQILVIRAQICDELCGQAEFPRILSQNCQNDIEVQGQWPPFSFF